MLKNKPFWFSILLTAAYLLTAYLAVPQWMQPKLEQYVTLQLGRQLQFGNLKFDPLTWSVELTEVRLVNHKQGVTGERELFPDVALSAGSVHLRFNLWRLQAAVSTLIVKAPVLTIDGTSKLMQSGPYPFASQWQQWRTLSSQDAEHQPLSIRRWRVEKGSLVLTDPDAKKPDKVLLGELFMETEPANAGGERDYTLAFKAAGGSAISMQGQLDASTLGSKGEYQWTNKEFDAAGEFSITTPGEFLLVELAQSQMRADQAKHCVLQEFICARLNPLNVSFSATLQTTTHDVRLLNAQAKQAAFVWDASLAQGVVVLDQQRSFESAQLQINSSAESTHRADRDQLVETPLEFDLTLQTAGAPSLHVLGQFHPKSGHAGMRFASRGQPEFRGDLQWQWTDAQQAELAYPQLELRLENPGASLAEGFMAEHLSDQVAAEGLHLQLQATLKDRELRFSESIRLQQAGVSPATGSPAHASTLTRSAGTLDAAWLLALLLNPQSEAELIIPEQRILLTAQMSLQTLIQSPILVHLNYISAQPFQSLALQMGKEDLPLEEVQFESGSAELSASSSESLTVLAQALLQRPGLGIELAGVYDPVIDRKTLQTEQIRTHIALATAAELAFQSGSEPPDFNDPTVHSVIDEFARRRLPAKVLAAFTGHFGEADVDRGVIPEGDVAAYYAVLFELLVDFAEIPQGALSTLARYRAQAVIELLAEQGVSRDRMGTAAQPFSTAAELSGVPLNLELRIHAAESLELPENGSSDLYQE